MMSSWRLHRIPFSIHASKSFWPARSLTEILKVGDQLPTEDDLIARFEVSRITVRRAIQNLVGRGLVEIRRGKGTFVAAPKMTQELTELSGFVEDMHALGRKPPARAISKEVVTADATVAKRSTITKSAAYKRQTTNRAIQGNAQAIRAVMEAGAGNAGEGGRTASEFSEGSGLRKSETSRLD
jgi:DNA-binding transcriptional regulator YhcF (GntR family)